MIADLLVSNKTKLLIKLNLIPFILEFYYIKKLKSFKFEL